MRRTKYLTITYFVDLPNQVNTTISILQLKTLRLREVSYLPVVTQIVRTKLGHSPGCLTAQIPPSQRHTHTHKCMHSKFSILSVRLNCLLWFHPILKTLPFLRSVKLFEHLPCARYSTKPCCKHMLCRQVNRHQMSNYKCDEYYQREKREWLWACVSIPIIYMRKLRPT